jgi:hypothetical protein
MNSNNASWDEILQADAVDVASLRREMGQPKSRRSEFWPSVLSGLFVGLTAGLVGGWLLSKPGQTESIIVGPIAGAVIGALVLRRIAALESMLAGTALGAFLPIGLILIDGIRSGRLLNAKPEDFTDPQALYVMGGMVLAGATLGTLLVAIRKAIAAVLR